MKPKEIIDGLRERMHEYRHDAEFTLHPAGREWYANLCRLMQAAAEYIEKAEQPNGTR